MSVNFMNMTCASTMYKSRLASHRRSHFDPVDGSEQRGDSAHPTLLGVNTPDLRQTISNYLPTTHSQITFNRSFSKPVSAQRAVVFAKVDSKYLRIAICSKIKELRLCFGSK